MSIDVTLTAYLISQLCLCSFRLTSRTHRTLHGMRYTSIDVTLTASLISQLCLCSFRLTSRTHRNILISVLNVPIVERGSSVVECWTLNRESPGSIPSFVTVSKFGFFSFCPRRPSPLSCINEYMVIDSGGNVSE